MELADQYTYENRLPKINGEKHMVLPDQEQAIGYIKDHGNVHVLFASDYPGGGAKRYVVSTYRCAFDRTVKSYKSKPLEITSYYQILQPDYPCDLYVDLEYPRKENPGRKESVCLRMFYDALFGFMSAVMHLPTEGRRLTLRSPNAERASYHLHFRPLGWKFRNLYHVGALMRRFRSWIVNHFGNKLAANPFFFLHEDGQYEFFADLGVYTKNRAFRLYGNRKNKPGRSPMLTIEEWASTNQKSIDGSKLDFENFCLSCPLYSEHDRIHVVSLTEEDGSQPVSTAISRPGKRRRGALEELASVSMQGTSLTDMCVELVYEHLNRSCRVYFDGWIEEQMAVFVGTYCRTCPIRLKRTGQADHRGNHIKFTVRPMEGTYTLTCYNEHCQSNPTTSFIKYKIPPRWHARMAQKILDYSECIDSDLQITDAEFLVALDDFLVDHNRRQQQQQQIT